VHTLLSNPQDLVFDRDYCEPQCVIMSPTRELAIQIRDVVFKLTQGTCIRQSILYGGTATGYQRNTLAVNLYSNLYSILEVNILYMIEFIERYPYISCNTWTFE